MGSRQTHQFERGELGKAVFNIVEKRFSWAIEPPSELLRDLLGGSGTVTQLPDSHGRRVQRMGRFRVRDVQQRLSAHVVRADTGLADGA